MVIDCQHPVSQGCTKPAGKGQNQLIPRIAAHRGNRSHELVFGPPRGSGTAHPLRRVAASAGAWLSAVAADRLRAARVRPVQHSRYRPRPQRARASSSGRAPDRADRDRGADGRGAEAQPAARLAALGDDLAPVGARHAVVDRRDRAAWLRPAGPHRRKRTAVGCGAGADGSGPGLIGSGWPAAGAGGGRSALCPDLRSRSQRRPGLPVRPPGDRRCPARHRARHLDVGMARGRSAVEDRRGNRLRAVGRAGAGLRHLPLRRAQPEPRGRRRPGRVRHHRCSPMASRSWRTPTASLRCS